MRKIVLSPERIAAMRAAFEAGQGYRAVAALGGMSPTTLRRHAVSWGWARRPASGVRPERGTTDVRAVRPPRFEPAPRGTPLRLRLERLLAHRIEALEAEAIAGEAVDPDANARAIAANTRTLALLRRLPPEPKEETASDDEPPRSLADLRDELRRHLERIAAEEEAGELPWDPLPAGDRTAPGSLAHPVPKDAAPT